MLTYERSPEGASQRRHCTRFRSSEKDPRGTLHDSIRNDRPHNEAKRAVYSDLTTLMGRAACHTGQTVTWNEMMKSDFQFCDYLDQLSPESPVPVKADQDGQFPVPIPGHWKEV